MCLVYDVLEALGVRERRVVTANEVRGDFLQCNNICNTKGVRTSPAPPPCSA